MRNNNIKIKKVKKKLNNKDEIIELISIRDRIISNIILNLIYNNRD